MFETDDTLQRSMFATSPRDWLPKDSDVWLYIDLFRELDLSAFRGDYSLNGRPSKDPEFILRTIFYGLTHRVTSVRALTEACRNDLRFIVLSGNQRPDRRTFDRFVRRHSSRLNDLFEQVVEVAARSGMVSLGSIALDGSRFKAKSNRQKAMKYEKMSRAESYIEQELGELKRSLTEAENDGRTEDESRLSKDFIDKERRLKKIRAAKQKAEEDFKTRAHKISEKERGKVSKSLNDSDAQAMAGKGEGFNFGYNAQAVVDSKNQIVIASDIHDCASDSQALPSMLDQVEEVIGRDDLSGIEVMADFGYRSASNISDVEKRGATCLIPHKPNKKTEMEAHFAEQITYDESSDTINCLAGKTLKVSRTYKGGIESIMLYHKKGECKGCPFVSKCKMWKDGKQRARVMAPSKENLIAFQRSIAFSRTDEFSEKYRKRKAIVEPVFGNIKNKGIKIFVTGLESVKTWWKMACTAHNIEKIVKKRLQTNSDVIVLHVFYSIKAVRRKFFSSIKLLSNALLAAV